MKPYYLHLEEDEELRQRLLDALGRSGELALEICGAHGEHLDAYAIRLKLERRVYEVRA